MPADQTKGPFEHIHMFEWDEKKRTNNLQKRGIDFLDVRSIFDNDIAVTESDHRSEKRCIISESWRAKLLLPCVRSAETVADRYRCGERAEMKDKNITVVSRHDRRKGKTDWVRVQSLTDQEIEAAVRSDPDAAPLDIDWSQAVLVVPPRKKAISIRVDPDVLDYFKNEGAGYQRRINAVLRSYVEQKQKRGKSA